MSWTITPQTKVPVDPFRSQVSLLLHGNQNAGQFIDSSPTPKSITKVGNVAPGSPGGGTPIYPSSNSAFGSAIAFDKVDDRLTLAASSDFAFGTGDFTVEFWAYSRDVSSASQSGYMQISATSGGLDTTYNDGLIITQGQSITGGSITPQDGGIVAKMGGALFVNSCGSSSSVLTVSTWQHIAFTRSSSTARLFVNGVQVGISTLASNLTGSHLVIGGYYSTAYLFDGYIDDLRITKGVARYTSNFSVPAAPFPDI